MELTDLIILYFAGCSSMNSIIENLNIDSDFVEFAEQTLHEYKNKWESTKDNSELDRILSDCEEELLELKK